jgi:hypothetical protein
MPRCQSNFCQGDIRYSPDICGCVVLSVFSQSEDVMVSRCSRWLSGLSFQCFTRPVWISFAVSNRWSRYQNVCVCGTKRMQLQSNVCVCISSFSPFFFLLTSLVSSMVKCYGALIRAWYGFQGFSELWFLFTEFLQRVWLGSDSHQHLHTSV